MDGSGSINPYTQFPKVKMFLKKIASGFQIGPTKTKIALVQFSGKTQQRIEFDLNKFTNIADIEKGIDTMIQLRYKIIK